MLALHLLAYECMGTNTITIRVPVELLDAIRQLAEFGDRSINAQIVRMLREQLEQEQDRK
jgi:hypothetical protein